MKLKVYFHVTFWLQERERENGKAKNKLFARVKVIGWLVFLTITTYLEYLLSF